MLLQEQHLQQAPWTRWIECVHHDNAHISTGKTKQYTLHWTCIRDCITCDKNTPFRWNPWMWVRSSSESSRHKQLVHMRMCGLHYVTYQNITWKQCVCIYTRLHLCTVNNTVLCMQTKLFLSLENCICNFGSSVSNTMHMYKYSNQQSCWTNTKEERASSLQFILS